mmetsp:Transcript_43565/g.70094  ORF Transcript_43565/g.70094 Transcript_43565/m.70094 type:complete len:219 (-) Transcript_43565:1946-2602(-)
MIALSALSFSLSKWSRLACTALVAASQSFLAALASLTSFIAAAFDLAASACALRRSSRASSASFISLSFDITFAAACCSTSASAATRVASISAASFAARVLRVSHALRARGAKSPAVLEAPASNVTSSNVCASASFSRSFLAASISFTSALMDLRPVTRIIMLLDAVPSSIPSLDDLPLNFARIFSISALSSFRNMAISSRRFSGMLTVPSGAPSKHS